MKFSGLALEVTLCRLGFHIRVCCLRCVEHMRTEGHCFLYIVYARGASLLDPCLSDLCMLYCRFCRTVCIRHFYCVLGDVLLSRFGKLLYCICALEGYFYVCMFKEVGYFPDF